ncbi:hypothetical protein AI27_16000 [Sphingomonas sp. BHC-A]|nr:hypothetical protein AI27_16000 [Sphingomonas sp. BHC-A]
MRSSAARVPEKARTGNAIPSISTSNPTDSDDAQSSAPMASMTTPQPAPPTSALTPSHIQRWARDSTQSPPTARAR